MDVRINDYQATPEERAEVRKLIETAWDPNKHIITLFTNIKTHLTSLVEKKNTIPYPEENFIKAVYLAVTGSKQFNIFYCFVFIYCIVLSTT